jgi:hypothetical protein
MAKKVRLAYYGGVDLNNVFKVKDVTAHLQGWLDAGNTTIQPNPGPFADPFSGTHKGFYAELDWGDGTTAVFLCTDNGQTIDFSLKPVPQTPSSTVSATGTIIVEKAWYGTSLPSPLTQSQRLTQSQKDVTGALQALINSDEDSVSIWDLPDPAHGHHKALYAHISNNGTSYVYMHGGYFAPAAGAAKDPIDFTKPSLAPVAGHKALVLNSLSLTYFGNPTPNSNYVFSACSFTIKNTSPDKFPPNAKVSEWVSVDFYASAANNATSLSSMTKIGDYSAQITAGQSGGASQAYVLTPYQLNGITREIFSSVPSKLSSGSYYVYALVRNDDNAMTGMFSSAKFTLPPSKKSLE